MIKKGMVSKTMEGFIQKLNDEGHPKYASELRTLLAMSRKRKDAITSLSGMTIPLLEHLIKYISMPNSVSSNKWYGEIKGHITKFNIRNKNDKGKPWLSIEYIQEDLNDVLSSPEFLWHMKEILKEYSEIDRNNTLNTLKMHKTIKSFNIKIFFNDSNRLNISINNQVL